MPVPILEAAYEQFKGIHLTPPSIEGRFRLSSGREILRIKFRIWPGRGTPIENVFRMEVLQAFKKIDPEYADWMVSINYEVEEKDIANKLGARRKKSKT